MTTDRIEYAGRPQLTLTEVRWYPGDPETSWYWMQQLRIVCQHGAAEGIRPQPETQDDLVVNLSAIAFGHKKRYGCDCGLKACMALGRLVIAIEDGSFEDVAEYMRVMEEQAIRPPRKPRSHEPPPANWTTSASGEQS